MTSAGTVLVVGGSHAEIPLIEAIHELGYRVVTSGNRPGDLGHAFADEYAPADFSRPDDITEVAAAHNAVGIVSGCNDFALLSTVQACAKLGLPGHDSYESSLRIHHKDQFRRLLDEIGIPTPRAGTVTDVGSGLALCEEIGFPVIVKPVDLTGGKGIRVCENAAEVADAIADAFALTRQQHIVIEQFMAGSRHGFTCFVTNQRVGFWFADDEQYYVNQYLVSGTTTPTSMPDSAIADLVADVEAITRALDLVDGLMHVQCILTAAGPRIVELCRRCPGDLYPAFVRHATRYDYARSVVRSELGLGPLPPAQPPTLRPIARHCLMTDRDGTLASITYDAEVTERLVDQMTWWEPGLVVDNHRTQKFGIIFLSFDDADEMRQMVRELPARIGVNLS